MNSKNKLFFFPPFAKAVEGNPYTRNYKNELLKYYDVIDCNKICPKGRRNILLKKSFVADIYVLNWVESIRPGFKNIILYLPTIIALYVILLRRKKIVWMLHNLEPHEGLNFYSRTIMSFLYKHSSLIITHSKEAYQKALVKTKCKVHFVCHPVQRIECEKSLVVTPVDLFIWGSILPYKGIAEFLSDTKVQSSGLSIKVLGKCSDKELAARIETACKVSGNISFENRRAETDELIAYCRSSKYVLFPYLAGSVSSSGALIDTLVMGGTPIGPNVGAFNDLSQDGLCVVYNDIDQLMHIIKKGTKIQNNKIEDFVNSNSWEAMVLNFNEWIK